MSLPRLFGTDGIRGAFGAYPLDEGTVVRLGRALARQLRARQPRAQHVVMGGDTRDSTPTLAGWLAAGLSSRTRVHFLGTVPTPAVAQITRQLGASCGVVISASHNPHPDNGIKLIDSDGFKWSQKREAELEAELEAISDEELDLERPKLGIDQAAVRGYLESLAKLRADPQTEDSTNQRSADLPLIGLRVALDTGNGAASAYAEDLFTSLGANVTLVHAAPDGRNINQGCGSTHPEVIAELTRSSGSDLGFSFDGDADRVILADETGNVRDGDVILYLWALDLASRGALPGRRIVATSMSNLGLEEALARHDISLVRCDVGDRVVVETMRREGVVLGGEQSGHIVNLNLGTTGDGLLTAMAIALLRACDRRTLSEMAAGFERFPQLIHNVRVREKVPFDRLPDVLEVRKNVEKDLDGSGRLVLRYSGTEPLARIMIEGRDRSRIEALAQQLAEALTQAVGV